jgi:hypothetical protein
MDSCRRTMLDVSMVSEIETSGANHPAFCTIDLPKTVHDIYDKFIDQHKYQEAIWLLQINGQAKAASYLQQWLSQYLLTAKVINKEILGGGATKSYLVMLANGVSGVFKPEQFNPSANMNSEVGAYKLDLLLNLNIVPCTVIRKVDFFNNPGSFQYFVADAQLASSLGKTEQIKPVNMLILDFLMANRDRYNGNYMYLKSLDKVIAIDNGWGLRGNGLLETIKGVCIDRRTWKQRWGQVAFPENLDFDPALYFKLRDLSDSFLLETFTPIIGAAATHKLLVQKKKVLKVLSQAYF